MGDDVSILSFQAGSKRQQDVSGQLSVATCDTVSVLPSRRQSVFTQTEPPALADAHLNTEARVEVGGEDSAEQGWQGRQWNALLKYTFYKVDKDVKCKNSPDLPVFAIEK